MRNIYSTEETSRLLQVSKFATCAALMSAFVCNSFAAETKIAEKAKIHNLSAAFYERPGLEDMPSIDYESMQVANVRDFGAVGDGEANDIAAFDKAIRALQPEGGIVYIPEGHYYFPHAKAPERKAWVPRVGLEPLKNIHFVGEGDRSKIIFRHAANDHDVYYYGWYLDGAEDLSIRDLRFEIEPFLQMRWHPGIGMAHISLGGSGKNIQLVNVSTEQGRMGFVSWVYGENVWLVDCDFRNTSADSVHFRNGRNVTVAYCNVENSGDDGIALWMASNNDYDVNYEEWGQNYRALYNTVLGIRWGRGIAVSGKDIEIIGNWVEQSIFCGINVRAHDNGELPKSTNVLIEDNTVVRGGIGVRDDNNLLGHNIGSAIYMGKEMGDIRVANNTVLYGESNGIGLGYPISMTGDTIEIEGNTIVGNNEYGIRAEPNDDSHIVKLMLKDNRLMNNKLGGFTAYNHKIGTLSPATASEIEQQTGYIEPADVYADVRGTESESGWAIPQAPDVSKLTVIDVTDYGAKGDGVSNDLDAFKKAFAQLTDSGGVIRVPAGEYRIQSKDNETAWHTVISQHLLLNGAENVHIMGEGDASKLIFASVDQQGLRLVNAKNCSIQKLALAYDISSGERRNRALLDIVASHDIVLSQITTGDSKGPGVQLDCSVGVLIDDCTIENSGTDGIRLAASRQVEIRNNRITGTNRHGIHLSWEGGIYRDPQYVRIAKNTIEGAVFGAGIAISSGNHVEVIDNDVRDCGLNSLTLFEQSRVFTPGEVMIQGNRFTTSQPADWNYAKGAISIYKIYGGKYVTNDFRILNNTLTNAYGPAIWMQDNRPQKNQNAFAINTITIQGNQFNAPIGVEIQQSEINQLTMDDNKFDGAKDKRFIVSDSEFKDALAVVND